MFLDRQHVGKLRQSIADGDVGAGGVIAKPQPFGHKK